MSEKGLEVKVLVNELVEVIDKKRILRGKKKKVLKLKAYSLEEALEKKLILNK